MGPNRSNKQEPHTVTIQRVGLPVDLSLTQNLNTLFESANTSNIRLEELQDIKQVLSIALHEHCSSHAAFVYNRSFYSPSNQGQHGEMGSWFRKSTVAWFLFMSCFFQRKASTTHESRW